MTRTVTAGVGVRNILLFSTKWAGELDSANSVSSPKGMAVLARFMESNWNNRTYGAMTANVTVLSCIYELVNMTIGSNTAAAEKTL